MKEIKQEKPKVFFKTFGCRTNLYDTQIMRENLGEFEHTLEEECAQVVVINSCTVTNGADSGVRSYVRKARDMGKSVVFAGCGVKTQGRALFDKGLVDGVLGHSHKESIAHALDKLAQGEKFFYEDSLEHLDSTIVSEFVGKSRAFIKIQEGCDFACSYCVIPSVRGKSRSLPLEQIVRQVQVLVDSGVQEVVLTGTNVGSYGRDSNSSLSKLLRALFALDGLKRVRIGSLEPSQIDEEFCELLAHPKLERHLHIALQHSHNAMLKLMNRANRFESDYELLHKIAALGYAIGTDYIVGHPGESEEIWEQAFSNVRTLPLTHIHPFVYSVRSGTASASMSDRVNGALAKERLHSLNTHIQEANRAFRQKRMAQDKPLQVLIEKQLGDVYVGLDEHFNKIFIESKQDLGQWVGIDENEIKEHNYAKI